MNVAARHPESRVADHISGGGVKVELVGLGAVVDDGRRRVVGDP